MLALYAWFNLQFLDISLEIVERERPNMLAILLGFMPCASINIIFSRSFMLRCLWVFMVTFYLCGNNIISNYEHLLGG